MIRSWSLYLLKPKSVATGKTGDSVRDIDSVLRDWQVVRKKCWVCGIKSRAGQIAAMAIRLSDKQCQYARHAIH